MEKHLVNVVLNDLTLWRLLGRFEFHGFERSAHHVFMLERLFQILLPLRFQVLIHCAPDSSLIDLNPTCLGF